MKKSVLIYPYQEEFRPILNSTGFQEDYRVAGLAAPKGWRYTGRSVPVGTEELIICDEAKILEQRDSFDLLLVPEFDQGLDAEEVVVQSVLELLPRCGELVCCMPLWEDLRKKLREACEEQGKKSAFPGKHQLNQRERPLKELPVPIVAIAGCWENTDKLEIGLLLQTEFQKRGFRVSQIGAREYLEFAKIHSFPWHIFDQPIPAEEMIYQFNAFVADMMERENPDVVILGVPGPIQGANWSYPGGFGVIPYLVFQAVTVDYLILSLFFCAKADALLEELDRLCRYKLGTPVDCFHLSSLQMNPQSIRQGAASRMYALPEEVRKEAVQSFSCKIPVRDLLSEEMIQELADEIIDKCS